jgi:hypothetical protein
MQQRLSFANGGADPFAAPVSAPARSAQPAAAPPQPVSVTPDPGIDSTTADAGAGAASSSIDPPQIPQTFGGGGNLVGGETVRRNPPADTRSPAAAVSPEVITREEALRKDGKIPEAIRVLSRLAVYGKDDHALLRLLAWILIDWGNPVMAREVFEHTGRRFGNNDTTERDLAMAELAAGRKDEALLRLSNVWHHVSRRDEAALDGRMSAALRIVLECAAGDADADLEIDGPDYELCSWRNPLPAFGGALSFDGVGIEERRVFLFPAAQPGLTRVPEAGLTR